MGTDWNDQTPIYRQLRERVQTMMLDGLLKEGDALPSVRQIAADYQINPITVSKAYQELVDAGLVEKRRGLGMYVMQGAQQRLLQSEKQRFLSEEWPRIRQRIQRLGLSLDELDSAASTTKLRSPDTAQTDANADNQTGE